MGAKIFSENNILIISILIGIVFLLILLILRLQRSSERKKKELETKFKELETKLNNIQLETIETKLNPHLFKNILNSIQAHAYQTYFAIDKLANKISSKAPMKKNHSGIGTQSMEQRLKIIYGENYKLEKFIENNCYIAHLKINLLEHKAKMLAIR